MNGDPGFFYCSFQSTTLFCLLIDSLHVCALHVPRMRPSSSIILGFFKEISGQKALRVLIEASKFHFHQLHQLKIVNH